jgi:hypothetical protein
VSVRLPISVEKVSSREVSCVVQRDSHDEKMKFRSAENAENPLKKAVFMIGRLLDMTPSCR